MISRSLTGILAAASLLASSTAWAIPAAPLGRAVDTKQSAPTPQAETADGSELAGPPQYLIPLLAVLASAAAVYALAHHRHHHGVSP